MARSAYQDHGADWVINNDADEFWLFPDGDAPSFLDSVAPGIAGLFVQRFNAVLPEGGRRRDGLAHPSQSCFFWRESVNALHRPLPPKCMHRAFADITVNQGNHEIFGHQGSLEFSDQVSIFHFPYRRFSSYQSKIQLGSAAYQRNKVCLELGAMLGDSNAGSCVVMIFGNSGVACRQPPRPLLKV